MSIIGKGRHGGINVAPPHFASTADQWANAGAALRTLASTISDEYGNDSQRGNIFYPREIGKTDGRKWNALPIMGRYGDIPNLGAQLPISVRDVWDHGSGKYSICRKWRRSPANRERAKKRAGCMYLCPSTEL